MTTCLLELVPDLQRKAATNGGEYAGPCPYCGGTDRFCVWPEEDRYWCRQCDRSGDAIELLREVHGLSFPEAASMVDKSLRRSPAKTPRKPKEPPRRAPGTAWQQRGEEITKIAEAALWASQGAEALAYLRGRGFADDTIHGARLGYCAVDAYEEPAAWGLPASHKDVWIPRGIVIPWRAAGDLWRLNVRRTESEPKYCGPAGWGNALYGADGILPGKPVVLTEGEFDGLAVAQEAGDVAAAVASGSTSGARHRRWLARLLVASEVLVAFDGDEAGEKAAAWWLEKLPRARRLVPNGKDAAGMLEAGDDVRRWVLAELTRWNQSTGKT